jgi:prepilin-type N-terminal cleavage/methylation domain-containing protein
MLTCANLRPVKAAVPAATLEPSQATRLREASSWQARLPLQPRLRLNACRGFTLVELLVSVGVLALLVFFVTSLVNSASTITTLGHKQMDADSQARQFLDRMAIDFAKMVKRNDLDYFAKGTTAPNSVGGAMAGNDRIAFLSQLPGYYPTGSTTTTQSPVSLIAYRVNADSTNSSLYNKLERMGKGLVWNAATADTPVVFLPLTIGPSTASPLGTWPAAVSSTASDTAYEVIGPQVFRFEYCYLRTNGSLVITPPLDSNGRADLSQIAAIVADMAVIDSKSKVLLTNPQITTLAAGLSDYTAGMTPGQLRANWQTYLDGITNLPRPAVSGIRLYERYFYLSPPTLLTP